LSNDALAHGKTRTVGVPPAASNAFALMFCAFLLTVFSPPRRYSFAIYSIVCFHGFKVCACLASKIMLISHGSVL